MKMKMTFAGVVALLGGVGAFAATPKIDGKLDDACWATATWHSDFSRPSDYRKRTTPLPKAEFAFAHDAHTLYVAARCCELDMDAVRELKVSRPWSGNEIEFFLSPSGMPDEYYHFILSPNADRQYAQYYAEGGGIRPDPFSPNWTCAFAWEKDAWTAEAAIPLSAFYMTRNANWRTTWRVNVSRMFRPLDFASWSPLVSHFHEPQRFRKLDGFPMRTVDDDLVMRTAMADLTSKTADGFAGTLKVDVTAAVGGEYEIETSSGAKETVRLAAGDGVISVPCVYRQNGRNATHLKLVRRADGRVFERDYPVMVDYDPVRVKLTTPAYRNNFYPGQCADRVAGRVRTAAASVKLTLEGPGFPTRTVTLQKGEGEFAFDTKGFSTGEAWLTVEAGGNVKKVKIRNLPPTGHTMTWVENGHFVMNGKPIIPRRMYGWKFSTSKAFDRMCDAEGDRLGMTLAVHDKITLEANRVIKGKEREACTDRYPSKELLDKYREIIEANRDKDFAGYYISDEPECRGLSPIYIKHCYDFVTALDPYHVVMITSRAGGAFAECADMFETHPYLNCGWNDDGSRRYGQHPREVGRFLDAFGMWDRPDKVVGFLPTAFAYNTKTFQNDFPTFDEYLCHSWAALIRGAKSLWPYAGIHFGDRPGLYEGVKYTFQSAAAFEEFLLFGRRTVFVKDEKAEGAVYELGGDRLLALVSYQDREQEIALPADIGRLTVFRDGRTVKGGETVKLRPFGVLLASLKPHDAGLELEAAVRSRFARDEYARTHRDNQLLGRYDDVYADSNIAKSYASGPHLLIDGTLFNLAYTCSAKVDRPYLTLGDRAKDFTVGEIRVWGEDVPDFTVAVRDGEGWRTLPTAALRRDGAMVGVTLAEPATVREVRLDFADRKTRGAKGFELYEVEVPSPARPAGSVPVSEVRPCGGAPALWIDGKPTTGLMHWNRIMTPDDVAVFRDAGIHLYSFMGAPPIRRTPSVPTSYENGFQPLDELTTAFIDDQVRMITGTDPAAKIVLRLRLTAPDWWIGENPDECVKAYDPRTRTWCVRPWGAPSSAAWRTLCAKAVRETVGYAESRWGDVVVGYQVGMGHCAENSYGWGDSISDYSAAQLRAWEKRRPGVKPPDPETYLAREFGDVRRLLDPEKDAVAVDFRRFQSERMADAVTFLARTVKDELRSRGRTKVCGVFYGYMCHAANSLSLFSSGHHDQATVLDCPDVDFLAAPIDYTARQPGGASFAQLLPSSVALHGKLYYAEEDTRFHLCRGRRECVSGDEKTTKELIWRNFTDAWAHGGTVWWMDLMGEGWYRDPFFTKTIAACRQHAERTLQDRAGKARIAVFASEGSLALERIAPTMASAELVGMMMPEIDALGEPYDVYRLEDVPLMAEKGVLGRYRAVIVLNAHLVGAELRTTLRRTLLCDGRTVLFLGWPGYSDGKTGSAANVADLTGISVRELPVCQANVIRTEVDGRRTTFGAARRSDPALVVDDEVATSLGWFVQGQGRCHPDGPHGVAIAARNLGGWRSVLACTTWLPIEVIRRLLNP